jgi:hypothetical protein
MTQNHNDDVLVLQYSLLFQIGPIVWLLWLIWQKYGNRDWNKTRELHVERGGEKLKEWHFDMNYF